MRLDLLTKQISEVDAILTLTDAKPTLNRRQIDAKRRESQGSEAKNRGEIYTKGVFSSENLSAPTGKKRGLMYTQKFLFKGKEEKKHIHKEPFRCLWGASSHSIGVQILASYKKAQGLVHVPFPLPDIDVRGNGASMTALLGTEFWEGDAMKEKSQ